jgi:pimeloyl-ACP methyl ester carboxylesterase
MKSQRPLTREHLFPLLLSALALACSLAFASPAIPAQEASNKADKKTTEDWRWTNLDGARIRYMNHGKGDDALVLIHGWTMNADNWRDQMPELSQRYRVIVMDLPGHGQSDKPQVAYSMDYFARAVEAVMRDANVNRAVLVGHSMGTPIARQFYRKYPAKTLAIVIVDGVLRPLGDKAATDKIVAGFRAPNYRDTVMQMLATIAGPTLATEALDRVKKANLNAPQHVVVSAMEGMADPSIWGDDKINVPVLAIMAKNPFFPPNIEEIARGLGPNVDFQMWDSSGHFIMMEKPKEFNAAVVAFLEKNQLLKSK